MKCRRVELWNGGAGPGARLVLGRSRAAPTIETRDTDSRSLKAACDRDSIVPFSSEYEPVRGVRGSWKWGKVKVVFLPLQPA